jgi:hypothetical protein
MITYTRSVTELLVCLYACFEVYMMMMLWCMLEAILWYILRHWHMLAAHIRCMVEEYTWYMILVVWYFVEVHH